MNISKMEVNPNTGAGPITGAGLKPTVTPGGKPVQTDSVSLQDSEAVNKGVQQTPDIRAESLARARELVEDKNYPSSEVIRNVSNLFAAKLDDNQD
jgi:hypothetical protein